MPIEEVLVADVAALNGRLKTMIVIAPPADLTKLRILCASQNMDDVYDAEMMPFHIATLNKEAVCAFNHPAIPFGRARGLGAKFGRTSETTSFVADIDEILKFIKPEHRPECFTAKFNFCHATANGFQQESGYPHIDETVVYAAQPWNRLFKNLGECAFALVNGANGELNTGYVPTISKEPRKLLKGELNAAHLAPETLIPDFVRDVADIVTAQRMEDNSVYILLKYFDIHWTNRNMRPEPQQRSLMKYDQ
jgi:hypothetical protein